VDGNGRATVKQWHQSKCGPSKDRVILIYRHLRRPAPIAVSRRCVKPRSPFPTPNANGCNGFYGNVFRWNGTAWQNVVCNGANATAPHPDSRFMAFDADGNLLQTNDGGIARLVSPNTASTRKWVAIDGNIRSAEFHSIAYDPLSNIVFGGTQDNGTAVQAQQGNFTWMGLLGADGGVVGVDASNSTESLRYSSFQNFGFQSIEMGRHKHNALAGGC
jgi:hypothetical protein